MSRESLALAIPPDLIDAIAEQVASRVRALVEERVRDAQGPWLDVDQAAEHLACKPHRIYDLVGEGRLRCAKDGRRSLFRREWLDAVLDEGTVREPARC